MVTLLKLLGQLLYPCVALFVLGLVSTRMSITFLDLWVILQDLVSQSPTPN